MNDFTAAARSLGAKVTNMLARGRVRNVKSTTKMQTLQPDLLDGETKDRMEHFEPHGFTSYPRAGAEVLAAFFDGDRSHGVVFMVADRRYRPRDLAEGDVAVYDHRGQSIRLTEAGIVIDCAGRPLQIINAPSVLHDGIPIDKTHRHGGVQAGSSNTSTPT